MKHTKIILSTLLFVSIYAFLLVSCTSSKKGESNLALQAVIDAEITDSMPGILVSVHSSSKDIMWSGASGLSDVASNTPLSTNQTFRIASVTKTFVAVAVLRLWEDGMLELSDPVAKYISVEHASILREGGYSPDSITIRHLLTHSSGMAEHTVSYKFEPEFLQTRHQWSRTEQLRDLITFTKPVGSVGKQFSYSDTGYILLGEVLERVTGRTMGDAIAELLKLKELGIVNTYMEPFDGDFSGRRIHQYINGIDSYCYHPSFDYFGGGGLLSTTADLCLFYHGLFSHKVFKNKSTLDTMLAPVLYVEPQSLDYRMGIWATEINGMKAYTHSGFWGTQVVYIPEIETAIAANYSQRWTVRGIAPVVAKVLSAVEAI